MIRHHHALLLLMVLLAGCASVQLPEVPEFHPASPHAPQSTRIEAFDVLAPVPAVPPGLPVLPGPRQAPRPMHMEMDGGHGMEGKMGEERGDQKDAGAVSDEHDHVEREPPRAVKERHAPGPREGMLEATPEEPHQTQHSREHDSTQSTLYRERAEDDVERGEAPMQDIKIPSEQRGMGLDASGYHEHKHKDSTHIAHPNRESDRPAAGARIWACPMHPDEMLETPGGRCPVCDAVLAPIPRAGR